MRKTMPDTISIAHGKLVMGYQNLHVFINIHYSPSNKVPLVSRNCGHIREVAFDREGEINVFIVVAAKIFSHTTGGLC